MPFTIYLALNDFGNRDKDCPIDFISLSEKCHKRLSVVYLFEPFKWEPKTMPPAGVEQSRETTGSFAELYTSAQPYLAVAKLVLDYIRAQEVDRQFTDLRRRLRDISAQLSRIEQLIPTVVRQSYVMERIGELRGISDLIDKYTITRDAGTISEIRSTTFLTRGKMLSFAQDSSVPDSERYHMYEQIGTLQEKRMLTIELVKETLSADQYRLLNEEEKQFTEEITTEWQELAETVGKKRVSQIWSYEIESRVESSGGAYGELII